MVCVTGIWWCACLCGSHGSVVISVRPVTGRLLCKPCCGHLICVVQFDKTFCVVSVDQKILHWIKRDVNLRWTGTLPGWVNDSHLLSIKETGDKHQTYAPSWYGEGICMYTMYSVQYIVEVASLNAVPWHI